MIDYRILVEAQTFYAKNDFKNIEVPWMVPEWACKVTRPPDRRGMHIQTVDKFLVASGEQGFIATATDKGLAPGLYQTTTPCFRDEPVFDMWHLPYFLKLELISVLPKDPGADLWYMIELAHHFAVANGHPFSRIVDTDSGQDIISKEGIELGSYGIRNFGEVSWVYGTGLALPRFTDAKGKV